MTNEQLRHVELYESEDEFPSKEGWVGILGAAIAGAALLGLFLWMALSPV